MGAARAETRRARAALPSAAALVSQYADVRQREEAHERGQRGVSQAEEAQAAAELELAEVARQQQARLRRRPLARASDGSIFWKMEALRAAAPLATPLPARLSRYRHRPHVRHIQRLDGGRQQCAGGGCPRSASALAARAPATPRRCYARYVA